MSLSGKPAKKISLKPGVLVVAKQENQLSLDKLFAYLKNLQLGDHRPIEGILLYPTIGKSLSLRYRIQGHTMRIVTVDLNAKWQEIRHRLLDLLVPASNAADVVAGLS